ncbi:MAG: hypothetical protein H3C38_05070 [Rhodospirillales bacterium]|nr:hypothetical protein [Rhodospirillales bacterium]
MASELRMASAEILAGAVRAHLALGKLSELAEDVRILSLNAELAAGRAGEQGRSIRVLTLATRELVRQLTAIADGIATLKTAAYAASAGALRTDLRLRIIERARPHTAGSALPKLEAGASRLAASVVTDLLSAAGCVEGMDKQTQRLSATAMHAGTIATNIAVEAAGAGAHGQEFLVVSRTMRRYAGELRRMAEEARGALARARPAVDALGHVAFAHHTRGVA